MYSLIVWDNWIWIIRAPEIYVWALIFWNQMPLWQLDTFYLYQIELWWIEHNIDRYWPIAIGHHDTPDLAESSLSVASLGDKDHCVVNILD